MKSTAHISTQVHGIRTTDRSAVALRLHRMRRLGSVKIRHCFWGRVYEIRGRVLNYSVYTYPVDVSSPIEG